MDGLVTHSEQRSWSTTEVDQRFAFSYWVDVICAQFIELDIDTSLRAHLCAGIDKVELGPVSANFLRAESQVVRRTKARIAASRQPVYVLMQLREGQMRLRQAERDVVLRPGECVFLDAAEPYLADCPQPTNALSICYPADWLRRWVPYPERCRAHVFAGDGWSGALCAAVAALDLESCGHLALPRSAVAEHIAALMALAIGVESQVPCERGLYEKLVYSLRDRLHECDLSPQALALQHHVSTRSVHYAFAKHGTTFMDQLMHARVERARELLSDVRMANVPVAEVAVRCGFTDPSHLARRFRRQCAIAPREFRRAALQSETRPALGQRLRSTH